MDRNFFKVREVAIMLRSGKPADLQVCSYDAKRPEKSGKKLELKGVTLVSYESFAAAKVRLMNGDIQAIHPVLITKYNNTRVIP